MDVIEKLNHRSAMKSLNNRCCCIMSMDIIMDSPQGKYIQRARDSAIRTVASLDCIEAMLTPVVLLKARNGWSHISQTNKQITKCVNRYYVTKSTVLRRLHK